MKSHHKENDNMPDPREGESKDDFMSRCMGDDKMVDEFGNPQQKKRMVYLKKTQNQVIHGLSAWMGVL